MKHICEPNFSFCLISVEKKIGSGVKIRVGRVIGNTLFFWGGGGGGLYGSSDLHMKKTNIEKFAVESDPNYTFTFTRVMLPVPRTCRT